MLGRIRHALVAITNILHIKHSVPDDEESVEDREIRFSFERALNSRR